MVLKVITNKLTYRIGKENRKRMKRKTKFKITIKRRRQNKGVGQQEREIRARKAEEKRGNPRRRAGKNPLDVLFADFAVFCSDVESGPLAVSPGPPGGAVLQPMRVTVPAWPWAAWLKLSRAEPHVVQQVGPL